MLFSYVEGKAISIMYVEEFQIPVGYSYIFYKRIILSKSLYSRTNLFMFILLL